MSQRVDIDEINVEEKNEKNSSVIIRNKAVVGKPLESILYEGCTTLTQTLEHICLRKTDKVMYGSRPLVKIHEEVDEKSGRTVHTKEFGEYTHKNFGTVWKMIEDVSVGMQVIFPKLEKGLKIGIWLETRMEWIICAHAMFNNSLILVTLYPDLTSEGLAHIINECEMEMIVINAEKLNFLESKVLPSCPTLNTVIAVREKTSDPKRTCEKLKVHYFEDVLASGTKKTEGRKFLKPEADDVAFLMYTSGTTDDVYMTYLPLSHSLEFVVHHVAMFAGLSIGFGSPRSLVAKKGSAKYRGDLEVIKPSGFVVVPRILETIKKEVFKMLKRQPGWKQSLFNMVLNSRLEFLKTNKKIYNGFWSFPDSIVFKRIRELFGGKCRGIISGGAPLPSDTQLFFQACFGQECIVFQGYGLSETCSAALIQSYHEQRDGTYLVGNVGVPATSVEIKLVDVPEMGYIVAENRCGEICIRGNNVSNGYYKNPEITAKAFREDGWFHSGDVGKLHDDGTVSIIDRIKNLVKLSQGEYIALEHLESLYGGSVFVQASGFCITPNSLKSYIVAVAMVDPVPTLGYARENGIEFETLQDLCKNEKIIAAVLKSFDEIHKEKGLPKYERICKVALFNDIFDVSNGTTTPSNKLKRRVIQKKYEKEVEEMYS